MLLIFVAQQLQAGEQLLNELTAVPHLQDIDIKIIKIQTSKAQTQIADQIQEALQIDGLQPERDRVMTI